MIKKCLYQLINLPRGSGFLAINDMLASPARDVLQGFLAWTYKFKNDTKDQFLFFATSAKKLERSAKDLSTC